MKRIASGAIGVVAILLTAGVAGAGEQYSLDFHQVVNTFMCSAVDESTIDCENINPNGPVAGVANAVFVILGGAQNGAGAVQFGIDYISTGETQLWNWTVCNNYQEIGLIGPNGGWPSSGSGNAVAFGGCVNPAGPDGMIAIGYLFTSATVTSGNQSFAPDPIDGDMVVTDCDAITWDINFSGVLEFAGAGGTKGCDGLVPIQETSWGEIKSIF